MEILLVSIFTFIVPVVVISLFVFFCTSSYRRTYRKHYKKARKKASKVNMKDWVQYYRDLPGNYSPAIVSILCDFQEELHKDLPAMILNLCANGYINITQENDDYKFTSTNKDTSFLSLNEKYVLDYILGNNKKFDNDAWNAMVIQDAKTLNLIEEGSEEELNRKTIIRFINIFIKPFLFFFIFFIILWFTFSSIDNFIPDSIKESPNYTQTSDGGYSYTISPEDLSEMGLTPGIMIGICITIFILFMILFIHFPTSFINELIKFSAILKIQHKFNYKRTEKGDIDYKNWIAFRNFLNDFSLINERDIEEVYLWEYYLAYATSLGIADRVLKSSHNQILNNNSFKITNYSDFVKKIEKSKKYF